MKKILYLIVCMFALTACMDDFLTVEPLAVITNENYWKSEADARAELNTGYGFIRQALNSGFLYWCELRGDNFLGNSTGSFPVQNYNLNRLSSDRAVCNWDNWYKVINVANYGLHFIPTMRDKVNVTSLNHLLSEAYFLRAYSYFYLYRVWGDVPLVDQPVLKRSEVTKPRQTGRDTIFNLVINDLYMADSLVDITVEDLNRYSVGALYALITDVAMWEKDYEKAIFYATKLEALNRYSVEGADFAQVCNPANTTDNIWTLCWNYTNDGENRITTLLCSGSQPMIPTFEIYQKWFAWEKVYKDRDMRRVCSVDSAKYRTYSTKHVQNFPLNVQCWKWSPGHHLTQQEYVECPVPLYRYADVLLMRAEALNRVGRMEEALEDMNTIRVRAGLTPKDLAYYNGDATKLEEDIWQERQFELYAEGKRWFDLMRTDRVETVMNTYFNGYIKKYGGKDWRDFTEEWQHYWPVYKDNLNENSNLHQIGSY